ncbi:hypothetical protein [Lysinibacillus fusiformis]|uniref:hypothetical protein n=1 Tax=Lysinibacillus fusiformis TaxID=28031 RepID=UPI001EF5CD04|nr:hypothetical protein [Lysinibacillus fusiformis]MCG7437670.1 hypothetical protein [Lysinibacillus fusiformis]
MKFFKKAMTGVAATVVCLSLAAVNASADTQSTPAPGYGTLTGKLHGGVQYDTWISQNPDNAYLTTVRTIQDKNGKTIASGGLEKSNRGETWFVTMWDWTPMDSYAVYGTHGVQGGTKYGAKAVYTYTHI